jgi:PAS domain S-box-containing protein
MKESINSRKISSCTNDLDGIIDNSSLDVMAYLPAGVIYLEVEGKVVWTNNAAKQLLGEFIDHVIDYKDNQRWRVVKSDGSDFPINSHPALLAIETGKAIRDVTIGIVDREKKQSKWFIINAIPIKEKKNEKVHLACLFLFDINNLKISQDLLNLQKRLGYALSSTKGLKEALDLLLEFSCMVPGIDCGGIFYVDKLTGGLKLFSQRNLPVSIVEKNSALDFASPQARLVMKGAPIYSFFPEDDFNSFAGDPLSNRGLKALTLIPVLYDGRVTASLFLFSFSSEKMPVQVKDTLEAIGARVAAVIARENAIEALRESEKRYRNLLESMNEGFLIVDENFCLTYANNRLCEILGYELDEIIGLPLSYFLDDQNKKVLQEQLRRRRKGESGSYELRWVREDGQHVVTLVAPRPILDVEGNFRGSFSVLTDVTELKKAEEALKKRERDLRVKTDNLEEVNTALKVLLERRDEDIAKVEKKILANVKRLIEPYLDKMRTSGLNERQKTFLDIIEGNLKEIVSEFSQRLSVRISGLTPTEVQIAHLIRQGKSTKEIADVLNLSNRTIGCHRFNMRRKMGLNKKKISLKSYLSSLK